MALRDLVPWLGSRRGMTPYREGDRQMDLLHRSVDHLFDRFMSEVGEGEGRMLQPLWEEGFPRVDVADEEKEIVVKAEIPGMNEKDFDVSLVGDSLVIRGEKRAEKESKEEHLYRMERSFGSFHRTIPLPCEIDEGKVEATYKKGVLKIRLQKTEEARRQTKRIEIH